VNRGLYGSATLVLSSVVALIGVAIVVRTVAGGGGPVAQGVLIGLLFVVAGAGRAWMAWRGATLAQPQPQRGPGASSSAHGRAPDPSDPKDTPDD
jgi:hypothetical protein